MSNNNEYPIPDLSSILATLAQFAPQATTPQPQVQPQESTTPPGQPLQDANQYLQSFLQQPATHPIPQPQTLQPQFQSQDPRLRNRSRTHTPDVNTLPPHPQPSSLPGLGQHHAYLATPQPSQSQFDPSQQGLQRQQSYDPRPSPQPQQRSASAQPPPQTGLVIDPAAITEWTAGLRCVNKIAAQNRDFAGAIKRVSPLSSLVLALFPLIFFAFIYRFPLSYCLALSPFGSHSPIY